MQRTQICDNFFAHCDQSGGPDACWPFLRSKNRDGYGHVWVHGRIESAHRWAYFLENHSLPEKPLCVLHDCDNPPCCNPAHLYVGTQKQNAQDREGRGRRTAAIGEASGKSKLTTKDVLFIRRCADLYNTEEMAHMLGVQRSVIAAILRRDIWKHVTEIVYTPLNEAAAQAAEHA